MSSIHICCTLQAYKCIQLLRNSQYVSDIRKRSKNLLTVQLSRVYTYMSSGGILNTCLVQY